MAVSLYRHFDHDGVLLYVGISLSAVSRLRQHRQSASWFDRIARVDIETFPSRRLAETAERQAIISERPLFNRAQRDLSSPILLPWSFDWDATAAAAGLHPEKDADVLRIVRARSVRRSLLDNLKRNFPECYEQSLEPEPQMLPPCSDQQINNIDGLGI